MFGKSKREAAAVEELAEHRQSQAVALMTINMKVLALEKGAERINRDYRRTEEAAAQLTDRLRKDFQ